MSENGLGCPDFRPNSDRNVQLKFSRRSDCFTANIQTLIFHEGHFKNQSVSALVLGRFTSTKVKVNFNEKGVKIGTCFMIILI